MANSMPYKQFLDKFSALKFIIIIIVEINIFLIRLLEIEFFALYKFLDLRFMNKRKTVS